MQAIVSIRAVAIGSVVLLCTACGDDTGLYRCAEAQDALRVDEISTLENVLAYPGLHDAPTIDVPIDSALERRVVRVQVLAMHPQGLPFPIRKPSLTVEVFAGDNPRAVQPWTLTQTLEHEGLEWTDVTLTNPASTPIRNYRSAWWTFDFTDIIPQAQTPSARYMVSVAWPIQNPAPIGYSNFDLNCQGMWGIYPASYALPKPDGGFFTEDDGWIDVSAGGFDCSYPMLRVEIEDIVASGDC